MKTKPTVTYYLRGTVERGRDYHLLPAYSEQGEYGDVQPWMTYRECYADAKSQGARAIIIKEKYDAKKHKKVHS